MRDRESSLHEKTMHGVRSFPLCVYDNRGDSAEFLGYHWHDEAEFIYVDKGDAVFSVNAEPVSLHEGEALFVAGGAIHSGHLSHSLSCRYHSIVLDLNMLCSGTIGGSQNQFAGPIAAGLSALPLKYSPLTGQDGMILAGLTRIITCCRDKAPGYEMAVTACLYSILAQLASQGRVVSCDGAANPAERYKNERFKRILDYIHQNYKSRVTVGQMAADSGMSVYYFCRFFKSMSGKTAFEYLNGYRVSQAALLLAATDRKLIDIAGESGFQNYGFFIKAFKKLTGVAPSAYRRLSSPAGVSK